MAENAYPFLRATFYRWVQLWRQVCPDLATAPRVMAVGDVHVENFGTWRDTEGRLVWGINDFDEVAQMPYTNDLVRLAVSARLAISENHLSCDPDEACEVILEGYRASLARGGAPFMLAEQHRWLRDLALSELRDPTIYWQKLNQLPTVRAGVPASAKQNLRRALPENGLQFRIVHRHAGLGSLGRRRFTALAQWRGGWVARETKDLVTSAWNWENASQTHNAILCTKVLDHAVRVRDPYYYAQGRWLVRRLAPDCSRIELASVPKSGEELRMLKAMGWETANIHLATKTAIPRVLADLKRRPARWLRTAAKAMAKATLEDWREWNKF
jgi:uncharacterized protein (DUF2252 family)